MTKWATVLCCECGTEQYVLRARLPITVFCSRCNHGMWARALGKTFVLADCTPRGELRKRA